MGEPVFAAHLAQARSAALQDLSAQLLGLRDKAMDALEGLLSDAKTPSSVRARVATDVIKLGIQVLEVTDFTQRLDAIEAVLHRSMEHEQQT
jgi:hypothetical protein